MKKVSEILHYTEKQQKKHTFPNFASCNGIKILTSSTLQCLCRISQYEIKWFYSVTLAILPKIKGSKDHEY